MSIGSHYQSRDLTVHYFQPLPLGGEFLGQLVVPIQDWIHQSAAFGGFDTAEFRLSDHMIMLEDWLENGLGRPIIAYDDANQIMWEGFVNEVALRQAGLEVTRGPLTGIANRLHAVYSQIDTTTDPPTPGLRKTTSVVNHTASQGRYGIWPVVLSLAGTTDANAEELRNNYLAEHNQPELTSNFSLSSDEVSLIVRCLGWSHTLTYPYNHSASSGTVNISTKVQSVLAAQVNSWISSDYGRITTNTLQVKQYENDDMPALDVIRGLVAQGDASDNRYLFGVYEKRQAVYEPASTQIDYEIRLADARQVILDRAGSEVPPWQVRPGRWVFFSDFMPGRAQSPLNLREDPRMLFIESVRFDLRMPFAVELIGGKVSAFSQKLAQLGLGGTSV